jgi:hypothetical protein
MNNFADASANWASRQPQARRRLAMLLAVHIVICCLSLVYLSEFRADLHLVMFDKTHLYAAALSITLFAIVSALFAFARFSFGYFVGFYFYTMILGYLWIVGFSLTRYDHGWAAVSAFAAAVALLVPALLITSPIRQRLVLSARAVDIVLSLILILSAVVIAAGAFYNFRLAGLGDIYNFRGQLAFPAWLRYAIGAVSNALLPFAFACFVARGNGWRAAAVLLLLLLFYPITLTKLALFSPFWLLFLVILSRLFEARIAVVLSLFVPILIGVALGTLVEFGALRYAQIEQYFGAINFRMIAFPSVALDVYSEYFSTHAHTWFCQISLLKPFMGCPYDEYLSVTMSKAYDLGNLNASLFATEGIASVGPTLAPLAVLACGLVISLANRVSAGLPPQFVLLSGGILPQVFLNVPLTTTLLSNGAALLFLLWYVTPRGLFEAKASAPAAASPG